MRGRFAPWCKLPAWTIHLEFTRESRASYFRRRTTSVGSLPKPRFDQAVPIALKRSRFYSGWNGSPTDGEFASSRSTASSREPS